MVMNDFNYLAVVKQRAADMQAEAGQARLARIAREARREQRHKRREVRRLQVAVNGRRGWWQSLQELFIPQREVTEAGQSAEQRQADKPATTAHH